ncbi:MAG: HEAT repeat domain-containing protein [Methanospirillum sp.]
MLAAVPGLDTAQLIAALGEGGGGNPAVADLLAQGGERALPELLRALASGEGTVRDGAVLALVGMGPDAWPALVPRLRDPLRRVRVGAARVLEETGWTPPDAREAFAFRTALGDWDAVAGMGSAAVPFLVEALRDADPGVREEVARALGRCRDAAAVRPLVELLARDPEEEVREVAAAALGALADPSAVPALREALADRVQMVRLAAATALEGLGWQPASDEETLTLLVATAQWGDLGRFGPAAAPRLVRALGDDSYGIRRGAGGALLTLGAVARPALERARTDPDPAVRDEAAALLARMGPAPPGTGEEPEAVPEAEEPATGEEQPAAAEPETGVEPEPEAELEAAPVPPEEPAPPTLADLAGQLFAGEPAERLAAAGALASMPPDRAVPALAGALLDNDPALREAAVASLGALATPVAMPLLVDRLADSDEGVRVASVRALAGPSAVPFLVAALGRPERDVSTAAAGLLVRGGYAPSSDRKKLELTLGLEDWRGLARFGADAVEPLAALLVHPDPDLRLGAVIALGELEGDRPADLLRQAYADPSPAVRNRAALLLHLRRTRAVEY